MIAGGRGFAPPAEKGQPIQTQRPIGENGMSEGNDSGDPLEFFRKMWNPMSFPMPGMFQPTMDPEEVDKKIFELQAVEKWDGQLPQYMFGDGAVPFVTVPKTE